MAPHRTISFGLALLALAASQAAAQDQPRPRNDGRDDGPSIRMGSTPQAPAEPAGPGEEPPAPGKTEPEQWVELLGHWPASDAKQASIRLANAPTISYPLLERKMLEPNQDWRMIAGVAATLGKIRDLKAIELIGAKLEDKKMYQHSLDLLDALVRIDPVGAKPRLFTLLLHPASAVVAEVEKLLAPRVAPGDIDALRDVYDAGGPSARAAALRLTTVADRVAARPHLVKALRDKEPEVAFAGATALATDDTPETVAMIEAAMTTPIDRQFAYATIAMALRTERGTSRDVDDAMVRTLLGGRGVKSLDQLCRAAAAVLLADLGYYHDVPLLDESLDKQVVPVLIDSWVGRDFWADMKVMQPLIARCLRRLTGRLDLTRAEEWAAWWEQEGAGFTARRVLLEVTDEVAASMVLTVEGSAAPGGETTTITASQDALGAQSPDELSLLIGPDEAKALAKIVNASGVLRAQEGITASRGIPNSVTVAVRAGRRERRGSVRTDVPDAGIERLLAAVADTRARLSWQRYRTLGTALDAQSFIDATAGAFSPERSADERSGALASLIVRSLGDRRGAAWNARALAEIEAMPRLATVLAPADIDRLLAMLGRRDSLDEVAQMIVRVLAKAGKSEVTPLVLDFLVTRGGADARGLMVVVLKGAPREQYLAALADARSEVRLAAFAAAEPGSVDDDVVARILKAVDDKDRGVAAEAVRALGRLRLEKARPLIDRLAEAQSELRVAAVEALGLLGGRESLPTIMTAYASDDVGLRVAAVQALAASREPEGLSAIVFAMGSDPSSLVREVAARVVVDLGGDRAASELRRLAIDPAQPPGPRARAISGYSQLAGKSATGDLTKLVDDASDEVADEAAVGLARWREPAAVPRLIAMLEMGRSPQRARHALEGISLESFGQRDPAMVADLYAGWWELSKSRGPKRWLLDALSLQSSTDDPALRAWAEGDSGRQVVPSLLAALRSPKWYLRRAADLALRDLLAKKVGEQDPWTTPGDVTRMADAWDRIWAETLGQ